MAINPGAVGRDIFHLRVDRTWDGHAVSPDEVSELRFRLDPDGLRAELDAPYHADPAPGVEEKPNGRLYGLWEFEVVELFLAYDEQRYIELEFGPHGHYLALLFGGIRQGEKDDLTMSYEASISGARWRARAFLPWPDGLDRPVSGNAYAIHGTGSDRRYLAACPVPAGKKPDFHQPGFFRPLSQMLSP